MHSVQQSEALSSATIQRQQEPSGRARTTEQLAEVTPLALQQSAGISAPADLFARRLASALPGLLGAEALRIHKEWLSGWFAQPRRQEPPFEDYLPRLESSLLESLREEPVEDGLTHPEEAILRKALYTYAAEVRAWLKQRTSSGLAAKRAGLLRLVGRLSQLQAAPWGYALIANALNDQDLEVRDAAIKALELWRGPLALKILREHRESERWLADHLRRVVEELKREV
jgi:hypothetical protein